MARIVRGQTLSTKQKEFVEAARAGGVSTFGIITRHIVPNVVGPVIVYVTLTIPSVILAESFLSFLGWHPRAFHLLGCADFRRRIDDGNRPMDPDLPGGLHGGDTLLFQFIGDGLRDALDPKDR